MAHAIQRLRGVKKKTGLGGSTIYDKLDPNSPRYDPTFPRQIRLGNGRAVGWLDEEIDAWLALQIERSRKAVPGGPR
jgi:prophage regulatory protein